MFHTARSADLLHGPLRRSLLTFALPIAASSMLQQLFNAADTAVVGRFADADALAAVGTNGEIVALLVSLSAGLAVGANVFFAHQIGSGSRTGCKSALHTALLLALGLGLGGLAAGQFIALPLLQLLHTPASVLPSAAAYLRVYFLGYPALLLYDFGAAILRAQGDSQRPFLILIVSGAANLLLNLVFVIVFRWGVVGVAAATGLSTIFSAGAVLWLLYREAAQFSAEADTRFSTATAGHILQVGIPAALQGAVFCFANLFVQAAVNQFGATATAGNAIAMNFEYFVYYLITAFGQTVTTFVSQNHAAGQTARCQRILRECLLLSVLSSGALTLPLLFFRTQAAGFFSTDTAVVQAACLRMLHISALEPICSFYEVPAGYLRGIGHSTAPAVLTILGTCLLRIFWIETIFRHCQTLPSLFWAFPASWVVTSVLLWVALLRVQKTC